MFKADRVTCNCVKIEFLRGTEGAGVVEGAGCQKEQQEQERE